MAGEAEIGLPRWVQRMIGVLGAVSVGVEGAVGAGKLIGGIERGMGNRMNLLFLEAGGPCNVW